MEIKTICLLVLGISTAFAFHSTLPLAAACRNGATTRGAIDLRACAKPIYEAIQVKLSDGLKPTMLRIVDNSHQHAGMIIK